eukprot:GHVU01075061.1.p1 GENE.GHVU01075061.1~~GHVU01075061.1.p1  ORF type:complete len:175 (-),score=22.43 GHVU01075061.1:1262-1786(-)
MGAGHSVGLEEVQENATVQHIEKLLSREHLGNDDASRKRYIEKLHRYREPAPVSGNTGAVASESRFPSSSRMGAWAARARHGVEAPDRLERAPYVARRSTYVMGRRGSKMGFEGPAVLDSDGGATDPADASADGGQDSTPGSKNMEFEWSDDSRDLLKAKDDFRINYLKRLSYA